MPTDPPFTRRDLLRTCGLGLGAAGLAGCFGSGASPSRSGTESATAEATGTTTGTRTTEAAATFEPPPDVCESSPAIEESGPLLRDVNTREAYRCVGTPLDSMEDLDPWVADAGTFGADEDVVFSGTQSMRIEAEPADERAWVHREFPGGIDLSTRDLSLAVNPGGEYPAADVTVQLFAPGPKDRVDLWQHLSPGAEWNRIDLGPTRVVGDPDLTDVRQLRVVSYTGGGKRVRFYVDEIRTTPKLDRGYVLLTFDDNMASQYETAFPLMEEYGFPGVVGVIPGTGESEKHISADELAEMRDAGWDVVSHPQRADPLPKLPPEKRREAFEESKRWLLDNGFERGARFVIWPYGVTDAETLSMGARYHALGFAGGTHPSGCPFMGPLSVSRVNGDYGERARKMVDFALEYNQVAVVMYHPVGEGGNHVDTDGFEAMLRHLDETGASVVTASHLWDEVVP